MFPIWWGEAPEAPNDSTKGKAQKRQPSISKAPRRADLSGVAQYSKEASHRAEPSRSRGPRRTNGSARFNGLIEQRNLRHPTLRYTDLAIREPRPTKHG